MLVGCSKGISQEEYDTIVAEKDKLQDELSSIKEEKDEVQKNYESYKKKYDDISPKYEKLSKEEKERKEKDIEYSYMKSWVNDSLGRNAIYSYDNKEYLQCIRGKVYELSEKGIEKIWEDALVKQEELNDVSSYLNYKRIGIKYLDAYGNLIVEMVYKKNGIIYEWETMSVRFSEAYNILEMFENVIE